MYHSSTIRGEFDLEIVRPDGTVRQHLHFKNLITDLALEAMSSKGVPGGGWTNMFAGTGNRTPVPADVSLVAPVANASASLNYGNRAVWDSTTGEKVHTGTGTFRAGSFQGQSLAEVGIGRVVSELYSRSLIKDANGDPTTITVLVDEELRVTYTLRIAPPASSEVKITMKGIEYTLSMRDRRTFRNLSPGPAAEFGTRASLAWSAISAPDNNGQTKTAYLSGAAGTGIIQVPAQSAQIMRIQPADANWTEGIQYLRWETPAGRELEIKLDPPLVKNSLERVDITVTHIFNRV